MGRLVHRLLARASDLDGLSPSERAAYTRRLLAPELSSDTTSTEGASTLVDAALAACDSIRQHPDLAALFEHGDRFHELPFSFLEGKVTVRGKIDCLIRRADGALVVVEFKTGAPHRAHEIQLDLYVRAARSMFPKSVVEGRLIYLSHCVSLGTAT